MLTLSNNPIADNNNPDKPEHDNKYTLKPIKMSPIAHRVLLLFMMRVLMHLLHINNNQGIKLV